LAWGLRSEVSGALDGCQHADSVTFRMEIDVSSKCRNPGGTLARAGLAVFLPVTEVMKSRLKNR
jgi:hypothetical protein